MRRRDFITVVGIAAALWPVGVQAQEAGRTYRLGFVAAGPRSAPYWLEVFNELRQAGFVEGQNLTVDYHQYGPHVELIPQFAAEVVKAKVDVIVATGDTAIRAVQQATTTIPILGSTDDMVGSGLVKSLARPDGNTTGTSILATELDGKRQEILIEAVPGISHMAALVDSKTTPSSRLLSLQEAARSHGIELSIQRVVKSEEIPAALDAAKASGAAALNVLSSPVLFTARQLIIQRVAALRLPAIYQFPEIAEEGGFLGYGPRVTQMYKELVAPMLVKLLRGAKPSDLPIEQPTKFELVVNLKSANALALTVPESFLARADKVIE
jgi:putative ABC transport system substrate-binding protein